MSESDWKSCLKWILRLGFLEKDEPLTGSNIKINDFAIFLRDGVVLCRLLNAIAPGAIDQREFSQRPQMSQFLIDKNIKVFLSKCLHEFKMADSDLFDIPDLFDFKDFAKVIQTLGVLSNTPLAHQSEIEGFEVECQQDYGSLKSIADKLVVSHGGGAYSKYDERIYQDILSIKRQESMMEPAKVSKMNKREHCLKEIVDTEKNYIRVLNMIVQEFKIPLLQKLSQKDVSVLFEGIEELHLIHNGFYSDLSKACQSRHGAVLSSCHMTISDCFIKWKERFLQYADYCSNLVSVNSLMVKLLDHPSSKAAIVQCQASTNAGKFRLSDLLTIPMQRVLRYHLLLKELIKNTDEGHPERKSLDKAHEEMQDLASYVNEAKRDNENISNIEDIRSSIINATPAMDFKSFGHLQMDGELKYREGETTKDKPGFMFLFDKVLLICKHKKTEHYSMKECYELMKSNVTILNPKFGFHLNLLKSSPVEVSSKSGNNENPGKTQNALVFYTKSEALRTKWVESFKAAIDNICPPGWNQKHRFILTTFPKPTICDVCRKLLRGVFFQGYKCKNTGTAVHKACILQAGDLNGPPTVPPRETNGHKARVTSGYSGVPIPPSNHPPLHFCEGDIITILSTESDPWWMGRNGSREGYFLKHRVDVIKDEASTPGLNQSLNPICFLTPHPSTPICPSIPGRPNRVMSLFPPPSDATSKPSQLTNQHSFSTPSPAPPLPARVRISNSTINHSPNLVIHPSPTPSSPFLDDFFGEDLAVFPWFVGEMTRDRANELLLLLWDGCYLVRVSNRADRRGELSLSLKYGTGKHSVKNIKIQRNNDKQWFLADSETFNSVQETIEFYQLNSLDSCFSEVPTILTTPFKDTLPIPHN